MSRGKRGPSTALTGPLWLKHNRSTHPHVSPTHTYQLGEAGLAVNTTYPLVLDPTASALPRKHAAPYDMSFVACAMALSTALTAGTITFNLYINGQTAKTAAITASTGSSSVLFSKENMTSFRITAAQTWSAEIITTASMLPATTNDINVELFAS